MTRERRVTILILVATLVIGILIGLLLPGFFHKYQNRAHGGRGMHDGHDRDNSKGDDSKKEWFANTINRIVQPDSSQKIKIKPVTDWASKQIEAIETSSNSQMSDILDSVNVQLKPILTEEQEKRLIEFHDKAQGHWKGRGPRKVRANKPDKN